MPQHGDVQALLVGKVLQLPLLVVDEGAGVGQPKLLRVGLSSAKVALSGFNILGNLAQPYIYWVGMLNVVHDME